MLVGVLLSLKPFGDSLGFDWYEYVGRVTSLYFWSCSTVGINFDRIGDGVIRVRTERIYGENIDFYYISNTGTVYISKRPVSSHFTPPHLLPLVHP